MTNVICSWSGGKDSCFALMQAVQQGAHPVALLNVLNENGRISRSHGLSPDILQRQAAAMGLPLFMVASSWQDYETNFTARLTSIARQYGAQAAVFGDIDLQPHREWEEKVCAAAGIDAWLPLWQQERKTLASAMIAGGIRTMIVSCNAQLGADFLGRYLDADLMEELEERGVDVCGENGEYHTVVVDCPLFSAPVELPLMQAVQHGGYWFYQPVDIIFA
ncbi:Dph6-related ATP pyrophosphatase [Chitinophaga lutea]